MVGGVSTSLSEQPYVIFFTPNPIRILVFSNML
jgi:hypothetical protein